MSRMFNSFLGVPQIPYNIIEKLASSNNECAENLWKLLKYTSTKALAKDNLPIEEKLAMLWEQDDEGATIQNDFNVFLKKLTPDSLNDDSQQTQLRIHIYRTVPIDQYKAVVQIQFDLLVHEGSSMVRTNKGKLVEKTSLMESYLLEILNGVDLGIGVNYLRFDRLPHATCESIEKLTDSKSISGRSFLLALSYSDMVDKGGACS